MGNKSNNPVSQNNKSQDNVSYHQEINEGLTLLNSKPEDKNKKTVAVIVSFCGGSSYDNLFTSV